MAEITAQAVKELREITDLPMMLCKQALVDAGGDQKKAIQILKEQVGKVKLDIWEDNFNSTYKLKNYVPEKGHHC